MRYVLIFLLLAAPAYGASVEDQIATLQSQIDSLRAVSLAAGAQRTVARVTVDSTLNAFGIKVLPDEKDSTWVIVDYPLVASSGLKKSFVAGIIEQTKSVCNAQDVGIGRLRMRYNKAIESLVTIKALLMVQ